MLGASHLDYRNFESPFGLPQDDLVKQKGCYSLCKNAVLIPLFTKKTRLFVSRVFHFYFAKQVRYPFSSNNLPLWMKKASSKGNTPFSKGAGFKPSGSNAFSSSQRE